MSFSISRAITIFACLAFCAPAAQAQTLPGPGPRLSGCEMVEVGDGVQNVTQVTYESTTRQISYLDATAGSQTSLWTPMATVLRSKACLNSGSGYALVDPSTIPTTVSCTLSHRTISGTRYVRQLRCG